MESAKELINSGLNATAMCCFAIPGGAPVGAAFVVLSAILSAEWPSPAPAPPPVNAAQLAAAVQTLKGEMSDAIYNGQLDEILRHSDSMYTEFENKCGFKSGGQTSNQGQIYQLLSDPAGLGSPQNNSDVSNLTKTYFVFTTGSVLDILASGRKALELASLNNPKLTSLEIAAHKTRTIGLYCFLGCFIAAYLKSAVTWGWGYNLAVAGQKDAYDQDVDAWRTNTGAGPDDDPPASLMAKYPALPLDGAWVRDWRTYANKADGPVRHLKQEMQHMIDYCTAEAGKNGATEDGLYTTMWKNWQDLDRQIAGYRVVPDPQGIDISHMTTAVDNGQKCAAKWDELMTKHAFQGEGWVITREDLDAFRDAIDAWRAALATVKFQTYAVGPKDTFKRIAGKFHWLNTWNIFDTNRDVFEAYGYTGTAPKDSILEAGMILKIYDADAVVYVARAETLQPPSQGV